MPILKVRPKGLNVDIPAQETTLEEWTSGKNIVFANDVTITQPGANAVLGTPATPPYWAQLFTGAITPTLYAGLSSLHATDGATHSNVTPAQGWTITGAGNVTGGMYNGFMIANDQLHAPVSWNGALGSVAIPLAGWPAGFKCKTIRGFKYYLVAGSIDKTGAGGGLEPFTVMWSTAAAPGSLPTWTPAATNDAGSVILAGSNTEILDIAPVGEQCFILQRLSTWVMDYVGGAFIFSNRRVSQSLGALGRNCWAAVDRDLVIFGTSDIVITDGQRMRSLLDNRMRGAVYNSLATTSQNTAFVARSFTRKEVIFAFAEGDDPIPRRAVIWNIPTNKIGLVDLPEYTFAYTGVLPAATDTWNTATGNWDSDIRAWNYGIFLGLDIQVIATRPNNPPGVGSFESLATSEVQVSGPAEVFAEKAYMDFGLPERVKRVTKIFPKMLGPLGTVVNFRVGISDSPDQPMTWAAAVPFTLGADHQIDVRATGRYCGVRLESRTARMWSTAGFDVEYQDAGSR